MTHTYAELFAGAGGLSLGLEAAGFHAAAHAEIEPHARAVLRRHWPMTRLDGDVMQVNGADYAGITLLSGGSPCQDLSVAGKRAGLTGSRSSLFHEQVRIWQESGAPYLLWENVYGALSSQHGRDFATVLSTLVGAAIPVPTNGWQRAGVAAGPTAVAAWRVLDLQHFGPPQRRVRVFILAARTGGCDPAEVLALGEGVCGHSSPRQQAREGTACRVGAGAESGGIAAFNSYQRMVEEVVSGVRVNSSAEAGVLAWDNELNASAECHGPSVARGKSGGDRNGVVAFERNAHTELMGTLNTGSKTGGGQLPVVMAFHHTQTPISGDVSPAIGRPTDGMGVLDDAVVARMVAFGEYATDGTASTIKQRDYKDATDLVVCGTLDAHDATKWGSHQWEQQNKCMVSAGRPRRLTPRECERLMSWPDDHTRYGAKDDGTVYELSDTARYRLCGNGVGSVQVQWIAERLMAALRAQEAAG